MTAKAAKAILQKPCKNNFKNIQPKPQKLFFGFYKVFKSGRQGWRD